MRILLEHRTRACIVMAIRVSMQTLKEMIMRSERLAALVAEQFALDLGDLETGTMPPVRANDDTFVAKPTGRPRQKARTNTCRA